VDNHEKSCRSGKTISVISALHYLAAFRYPQSSTRARRSITPRSAEPRPHRSQHRGLSTESGFPTCFKLTSLSRLRQTLKLRARARLAEIRPPRISPHLRPASEKTGLLRRFAPVCRPSERLPPWRPAYPDGPRFARILSPFLCSRRARSGYSAPFSAAGAPVPDTHVALSRRKDGQGAEKAPARSRRRIHINAFVRREDPDFQRVQLRHVLSQLRE
jgi:hypothetical protein